MPENIYGYIHTPIDLGYVVDSDRATPEERELAEISTLDGELGLAASDFSQDLIWTYRMSPSEAEYLSNPEQLLEKHKVRMVSAIVMRDFPEIGDVWPELYVERFALLIVRNSSGVVAISSMISRLLDALSKHAEFSTPEANVWTVTWLNMYRLGEVHERWIRCGNAPILADSEGAEPGSTLRSFVDDSLHRLEDGRIHVGPVPEERAISAAAVYDHLTDTLLFNEKLFFDPVIKEYGNSAIFTLVVHEMFHSWQDAHLSELPLMANETDAELFDSKASFLLFGEDYALRAEKGWMKTQTESFGLYVEMQDVLFPLKVIIEEYTDPESLQSQHEAFRLYRDAVALEELKTGVVDPVKRERVKLLYTQNRLFDVFFEAVSALDAEYASDADFIETREFRRQMKRLWREEFSREERHLLLYDYNSETHPEYTDYLHEFVSEAAMKFFLTYYIHGEGAARVYFKTVVEPELFSEAFPDAMERFVVPMDGIAEETEHQAQVMTRDAAVAFPDPVDSIGI